MVEVAVQRRSRADLLRQLGDAYKRASERVAEEARSLVLEAFEAEEDPWGEPWAPLSDTTLSLFARGGLRARQKASRPGSQPTRYARRGFPPITPSGVPANPTFKRKLQDTGRLLGSIVRPQGTSKVIAGVRYAAVHQFGNPDNRLPNVPRGRPAPIPARPFFPMRAPGVVDLPREWVQRLQEAAISVIKAVL